MRPSQDWHRSPLGRIVCFLGSIEFAVPLLVLVAAALAWGTYLESTQGVKVSRATVYGSWWFIVLMGLICVSLIFAVITRYPWKRKHVGFITVHAGLVLLIFGGFWSLFGRLEGHVTLEEGTASNILETDEEVLELAEFVAGKSTVIASVGVPRHPGTVKAGDMTLEVEDIWENTREEPYVADDGPQPFRAIEISLNPTATSGHWIGDESKAGGPSTIEGLTVRVLADGSDWQPPAPADAPKPAGFCFTVAGTRYPLAEPGREAFPGWVIVSVQHYARAMVSGGRITEGGAQENPAVEVVISDSHGTTERHTAFQQFPEMIMSRTLEGNGKSGASLSYVKPAGGGETLVVFGPVRETSLGYVAPDGTSRVVPLPPTLPAEITLGARRVKIFNQFAHARVATRYVQAPKASERRPAIVLRIPGSGETVVLPWKAFAPLPIEGRNILARYGPAVHELPFTIHLKDFRKVDYPGTAMAMAYESDVVITAPGKPDQPFLIHMNTPYEHAPWKVYQSGFVGETISVFSVMRDPGLPLTYLGSTILCIGIFLTFFSRSLSWGHPGIPAPTLTKEASHAPSIPVAAHPAARPVSAIPEPVGTGG